MAPSHDLGLSHITEFPALNALRAAGTNHPPEGKSPAPLIL